MKILNFDITLTNYLFNIGFELKKYTNSGQSYKQFPIVIYDSRVETDLKIPHIMTLDS